MAGLKAKSSSRESRFRKGGGGEGRGVQQVEILEEFFWIMRVGVTIFRPLQIILKEKVFFDFVFWPSSSSVEVSLDLKALKTLRDRAVLSFDHALSTTGRAGPNDLKHCQHTRWHGAGKLLYFATYILSIWD